MLKKAVILIAACLAAATTTGCTSDEIKRGMEQVRAELENDSALSGEEIAAGLKEALAVGSGRVSERLSVVDAFNKDPAIHIPLPEKLRDVRDALEKVGLASSMDRLEVRLNRAAERAAPEAKAAFMSAIRQMTLRDVMDIYNGPDDAATQYFQRTMSADLAGRMRPIIRNSMNEVGAIRAYDDAMKQYQSLPFVPDVSTDLTNHVVDGSLEGIFHYLAKEEAAIRNDPVARTTELLRRVFGR
ncbi:MAG: DUF4197 domain-containing protein [Proteobacteria bacterium]|nr:DUF4197 domain-containing protein [Pseudomonadota bacterium]